MNGTSIGRFWAVGVGPGDPELLTVKAVGVLRRAHVIYHAGPDENQGRAWDIIKHLVGPEQQTRHVLAEPMSVVGASDGKAYYRRGVEQIAAHCRQGLDVAFVTEGDPTLYSTAVRVWQMLAELDPGIPIEVVPGITSITAAAARLHWPLAQKEETLAIVPANYQANLGAILQEFPSLCLLKVSQVLPQIEATLEALGAKREVVYVENVGTAQEWITRDLKSAAGRRSYFALVLARRPKQDARREQAPPQPLLGTGKVWVVGLGPGDPGLLTQQALEVLRAAEVVVGYEGYLKLLAPLELRGQLLGTPIGAEADRARQALELARAGRRVALVSSGDAGVYGMASPLLELGPQEPPVEIEIAAGVTAATAAAAALGAPLGHDFACVSLSDLLTPWPAIEQRLEAAGQGDFVLALYNPISQRRDWQLSRARDVLLKYRKPETPVGLVDKAYRPGMRVWQTSLGQLGPDGVTMETTIIIGCSRTRVVSGRLLTPRTGAGDTSEPRPSGGGVDAAAPAELSAQTAARSLAYARGSGASSEDLGRQIMRDSFAIIERELGRHSLLDWAAAVVRRMIHASADFEFVRLLRHSAAFETAVHRALQDRMPIVTDTEMVLLGIQTGLAELAGLNLACHLNDPESVALAAAAPLTRSAAGIRLAAQRYGTPLLVIGNAPTALQEALRLVDEEGWRPAAIIGMPVGFVGVEEAKRRLLEQSTVPYLTCVGRKGGSAVAAAAVNALVERFGS